LLTIRLPHEVEERLRKFSVATGRAKSSIAREAIIEHLADLEDFYLAEQRLADLSAGLTRSIPIEEVMRAYKLPVV
jgi:RHH-type rel operon transcriptional repressor/antitoxin RelB